MNFRKKINSYEFFVCLNFDLIKFFKLFFNNITIIYDGSANKINSNDPAIKDPIWNYKVLIQMLFNLS